MSAVPWCETCDRFYNPGSVAPDGTCVRCGSFVGGDEVDGPSKAPWHFWLLVVALVVYLGWRALEAIGWLVRWATG